MIAETTRVTDLVKPYLQAMVRSVEETIFVAVRRGDRLRVIEVARPARRTRVNLFKGDVLPLSGGAVRRALLSEMAEQGGTGFMQRHGLSPFGENSGSDAKCRRLFRDARRLGCGVDLEECAPGAWGFAVPHICPK
jgi:DNA-binding IclR family transcriptional regulator